ncbi:hypothetical protein HDU79_001448 [Rhizoclosmatium sp. JEL0117]|nr:hypothetical protein HDU79_001448 [Rhizoclosmatium sp. JEL0117]
MVKSNQSVLQIGRNKHWPYIASYHGQWQTLPIEVIEAVMDMNMTTPARSIVTSGVEHQLHAIDPLSLQHIVAIRLLIDEAAQLAVKASQAIAAGNTVRSRTLCGRLREMAIAKMAKAYRLDEVIASVVCMQCASAVEDVAKSVLRKNPDNADALYVQFFHEKIPSRTLAQNTTTEVLDRLIESSPMTAAYYRTRAMVHGFKQDFPAALKDFKQAIMLSKKNPFWTFEGVEIKTSNKSGAILTTPQQLQADGLAAAKKRMQQALHDNLADKPEELYESQVCFLRGATHHQYAIYLLESSIHKVNQQFSKSSLPNEQAVQTPSTAFSTDNIMLGKISSYKSTFNQIKSQLVTLAKKSIKDYVHFLSHFSMTMEPFEHNISNSGEKPNTPPHPPPRMDSAVVLACSMNELTIATKKPALEECTSFVMAIPSTAIESRGIPQYSGNNNAQPLSKTIVNGSGISKDLVPSDMPTSVFEDPSIVQTGHIGTYHPLLMEAWFAIGLNYMLIGDFATGLAWHDRVMKMLASVDGFPVFMTARCMSHSDYWEVIRMVREKLVPGSGKATYDQEVAAAVANAKMIADGGADGAKKVVAEKKLSDSEKLMRQLHTKRADTLAVYIQHLIYNTK